MAKLYFYYSAMNAGKTTTLLQSDYNYRERGMDTLIFTAEIDNRDEVGFISSRIGLKREARIFHTQFNFFQDVQTEQLRNRNIRCVLIDEAQFLTCKQVRELCRISDELSIPVLTYGLRTDFLGNLFPGSAELLALAEEIIEIKTICVCGRKATMNMRIDSEGIPVVQGQQIEIGGNDQYISMCRRCFSMKVAEVLENQRL